MTTKNPYGKNYVDHYLQLGILEQLTHSEMPVKFSDLKSDDLENSLFMYHMNKLIQRGVVEKRGNEGFALTPKGADWINTTGITSLDTKPLPRPLVQLVIRHNSKLLISIRRGQIGEHLNKHLLPGGLHKYGLSADETARQLLKKFFPDATVVEPMFVSVAEMIVHKDEIVHHAISHIFSVNLPEETRPVNDPLFDFMWIDLTTIAANEEYQKEEILQQIVEKLSADTLQQRELFVG